MKFGFHSDVVTRSLDGVRWQLLRPLRYTSLAGSEFIVPGNFITDFASSRIGAINLLPPQFAYNESPVLHDWLYYSGTVDRAVADRLFKEALGLQNATSFIQFKAYRGVRLFGWRAWNQHRQRDNGKLTAQQLI